MTMMGFRSIAGCCALVVLSGVLAVAQEPVTPETAPVPPLLLNAKTVFLSNAGADSGLFPHPFSGDPDRAYNQFYADVSSWGRYQLVATPAEADLVFELQLSAPNGPSNADKQKGASDPLPMFRLVIYDRPTHYVLWALTESVAPAAKQKTHDHNFDEALASLVLDAGRLTKSLPSSMH
ncbi:hypothetical protein [Granulicella sp. S190]|uniref:hypothetical protein n=1 Tax=Granulicella sp. S190 TaxID=1747226 RepID=UPI00131C9804|nr:hypothetical protein [Granulicella sp. S190]